MKIFHIVCHTMEQYYPFLKWNIQEFTNLEHSVNVFVQKLHKQDTANEHILVNLSSSQTSRTDLVHSDGYKVIVLPWKYFGNEFLQYSKELLKFVSKEEGIFHIHGTSNFLFDIISKKLSNKKAIAHHRGWHFTLAAFSLSFPKYFLTFPRALKKYKKILVENPTRKVFFEKKYWIWNEKIEIIPGTLDIEKYTLKEFAPQKVTQFLYVGRIEKNKWVYDLLEAFESLKLENATLRIVWDGSSLVDVKQRFWWNKQITFYGFVKPEWVIQHLQESDIFVHPSYSDSFGLSVLEALWVWLTIISTNVDWPISILQQGEKKFWYLYQPWDIQMLKTHMQNAFLDTLETKKMRWVDWRKRVIDNFTFDVVSKKLSEIYTSL